MANAQKTAIITGASGGIGAGLVEAFLKKGYNVVATSLNVTQSLTASPNLVLVDGDIGKQETAAKAVEAAIKHFGTIDALVNNAPSLLQTLLPRTSMPWSRLTSWDSFTLPSSP
jgi:NAD(P)-dependent dehydrogenase (short-subunit alcohol dehydrogenase family)